MGGDGRHRGEFQEAAGLTPTGVVRASTWRALLKYERHRRLD